MILQNEFEWYLNHQNELVKQYSGQYLVISGQAVVYSSESKEDAYQKGISSIGVGKFILQLCTPGTEAYTITYHTHRVSFKPTLHA
jgi:hypothetical protein